METAILTQSLRAVCWWTIGVITAQAALFYPPAKCHSLYSYLLITFSAEHSLIIALSCVSIPQDPNHRTYFFNYKMLLEIYHVLGIHFQQLRRSDDLSLLWLPKIFMIWASLNLPFSFICLLIVKIMKFSPLLNGYCIGGRTKQMNTHLYCSIILKSAFCVSRLGKKS